MRKRVLIVAPHPDDESLGCGGTLLKHIAAGDLVYWLISTTANNNHAAQQQHDLIRSVSEAYGFESFFQLRWATTTLDTISFSLLMDEHRGIIHSVTPDVIYSPAPIDAHSDHRVVFDVLATCLKRYVRASLFCYETPSQTDYTSLRMTQAFVPQRIVDVSDVFEDKMRILVHYRQEIEQGPATRAFSAVRRLAKQRGSLIGVRNAEAFMVVRDIWS